MWKLCKFVVENNFGIKKKFIIVLRFFVFERLLCKSSCLWGQFLSINLLIPGIHQLRNPHVHNAALINNIIIVLVQTYMYFYEASIAYSWTFPTELVKKPPEQCLYVWDFQRCYNQGHHHFYLSSNTCTFEETVNAKKVTTVFIWWNFVHVWCLV